MAFANTFITLDDVDVSSLTAGKFLRIRPSGNLEISQYDITSDTLTDIETTGAYTPSVGQTLVYTAAGKFRPQTLDVYSAGNGINKSGLTLNVTAGVDGGLVSNTSGVFIADVTDAANVAATHGNATTIPQLTVNSKGQITGVTELTVVSPQAETLTGDYAHSITGTSGQITVTGGTGNKANAVLNLVATGVTAGIYGNATAIPRITVDTYGRISSVDTVNAIASGEGGDLSNVTTLAYANIHVAGQTSLGADRKDDDLTFAGGTGINATTNANTDTISFAINPTTAAAAMDIANFNDVDASGITNGQVLVWNSSTSKFEANDQTGSGGGGSNVGLTDFSVTTATPSGNGSLAYDNAGVFTFTPADTSSGGGGAADQTLSASGNIITISGSNDTVDLTTMLAPYSKTDTDAQDLTISGNVISLTGQAGNVDLTSILGAINTDAQTLTWNAGTTTLSVGGGNSVDLSALEQTLSISGNVVTISGNDDTVDLSTALSVYQRTADSSTANTEMKAYVDAEINTLIGGANVNLDSLGEVANALANSNTELSTVAFTGTYSDLQTRPTIAISGSDLTYDGTTLDLSGVGATGPQGPAGSTGATGNGVTTATLSGDNLILSYSNTSTQNLGNIRGPQGPTGAAGADSTVAGPTGATGPAGTNGTNGTDGTDGTSISSAVNNNGAITLTMSDSSTVTVSGNVQGATGATGSQGIQGIQGPAGNDGADGADGAAGAVDQTLSASGNVITISGNNDTVDLTTMLAPYSKTDTDAQDLTLSGNVISLTGLSGNVDLTTLLAGGGGGASTLDGLTDVSASSPSSGQVLKWNGSAWAPAADLNSGGGGGGATVQRFKLNYDSTGSLSTTSDLTSLINSATISSDIVTITFDSSINYPPASIMIYGYDYTNNKYLAVPLETTMSTREIAGGGSSGSPTLFNGSSTIALDLRLREAETGASRTFGQGTHAWVEFVVYD